jgi:hypothetical protein
MVSTFLRMCEQVVVFVDLLRGAQESGRNGNPISRPGPLGYTGWWNRFLGIDS